VSPVAWGRVTRAIRIFTVLGLALSAVCFAVLWVASGATLKPRWYEHRIPEQGLAPRDGDPYYEEGWQGVYRDPRRDFGYAFEDVSFAAVDGSTLRGWLVPGRPGATAAVVTVHGAGADRRDFLRHLPLLHEAGYAVLQFDCREHGISDGAARGISLGAREHRDVSSAVDYLKRQRGFRRVAVLGTSQGGASVILAAAADPSIDVVIAENPFTRIVDLMRDSEEGRKAPVWLIDAVATLSIWRMGAFGVPAPIDVVGEISPRPLLLMHGTEDTAIPVEHSQRLRERAGQPVELWIVPGARHAALFNADAEAYRERVVGFLQQRLGPPSRGAGGAGALGSGPGGPGAVGSALRR